MVRGRPPGSARPRHGPAREKARGREEALATEGLDASRDLAHEDFTVDGGRRALRAIVEGADGDRPTAVICSNDLMAIGTLNEAAALGVRVPDDLSIVGFDGIEAASWTQPALTTVEQPIDEIAGTAIEALQDLVDDPGQTPSRATSSGRRSEWVGRPLRADSCGLIPAYGGADP